MLPWWPKWIAPEDDIAWNKIRPSWKVARLIRTCSTISCQPSGLPAKQTTLLKRLKEKTKFIANYMMDDCHQTKAAVVISACSFDFLLRKGQERRTSAACLSSTCATRRQLGNKIPFTTSAFEPHTFCLWLLYKISNPGFSTHHSFVHDFSVPRTCKREAKIERNTKLVIRGFMMIGKNNRLSQLALSLGANLDENCPRLSFTTKAHAHKTGGNAEWIFPGDLNDMFF